MSTQPAFDLRPDKRIASTSIAAYREIAPSLSKREADVLAGLRDHAPYGAPTAYELYAHMSIVMGGRFGLFDLNSVRPRLTALLDKKMITKGEKRTCRVTGRTAFTWEVA